MPRKMSGIAMIVIEPSSVARRTASVAFERAIHLYRSSPALVTRRNIQAACTDFLSIWVYTSAMAVQSVPMAHELRETLGRLVRRLRAEGGQPPVGQMAVLGRLDREGPASTSDLAAAERMRPQSMAQTVRDLESAGLVSRRPDPGDARRMLVELTPAGLERLRATRAQRETW